MLEARGLHKIYASGLGPVAAVAGVSLNVAPGEFVAVCGRSGSGKSTLLGMLGGLCRPDRGMVVVEECDVWARSPNELARFRNRHVGFVFQFASLLPTLRAIDNVALPALIGGADDLASAYARAADLLREVGLYDRADAYPGELSGGEQRRVALARALVNRPPLLLADEPTSDLDEDTETEIFDLLLELRRRHHTTLLVVTHNLAIARRADRVIHLRNGSFESVSVPERPTEPAGLSPRRESGPHDAAPAISSSTVASSTIAPSAQPVPLGAGLGRFWFQFATWAVLVALAILGLNYATASFQRRSLVATQTKRKALEDAALKQLRADVENLEYAAGGSCLLTLYLENTGPAHDLFVLVPSLRVYVQVGRDWVEVPARSADNQEGQVIRVTDRQRFQFLFEPDVKGFEEQIAGYMHIRVTNPLLISTSREPADDLFERADAYYVYLKPPGADDAGILRRNNWSGKPPLWIPMPPH